MRGVFILGAVETAEPDNCTMAERNRLTRQTSSHDPDRPHSHAAVRALRALPRWRSDPQPCSSEECECPAATG
jgi:hypothetical protein